MWAKLNIVVSPSSFVLVFNNGTTFPSEIFLQNFYIKREKMIYNWPLMTHIYVVREKLIFLKVVFCYFSLFEKLFLRKVLSRTFSFRGKKWCTIDIWWLIYICYVSKIDVFQSSFLLVFTNGSTFLIKLFSRTCTLTGKNDVQLTFDESYIYVIRAKLIFLKFFALVFTNATTFS